MKYTRILLSALVMVLMSLPGLTIAEADINQIHGMVKEGKLEQALTETNAILEKDKDNMQALFLQGLIYTRMNKLDKAEKIFLQLNKTHPELPEPYNNLAVIYASQGQFEKARDALQKAINTHPSYATAHENLGDIYAKMASQAYNHALELDDSNQTAREKLSLINELFSAQATKTNKEEKTVEVAKADTTVETATPPPESAPPKPVEPEVVTPPPVPQPPPVVVKQPVAEKEIDESRIRQTILNNISNWSKAWARQDVDAYLSFYEKNYSPDKSTSHNEWVASRKKRLSEPAYIKVGISNVRVIMRGDEHAQAIFSQDYQSDTYSDSVTKTLLFRNMNNRWLIVQEKSE